MDELDKYNTNGGYNPYKLLWGEEIQFPSTRKLSEYGNRIYNRYPARSIFLVPRAILSQYKGKNLKILDPFMGSGTTAVETIMSGNIPYGAEMDEFARVVAEVSTTIFTESDFCAISKTFDEIMTTWKKYTPSSIPRLSGIERWFNKEDIDELLSLRNTIISTTPEKYFKFMIVAYADCIKPISKMERQSTKPYISSKYVKKTKPVEASFRYSFKVHYEILLEMAKTKNFKSSKSISWLSFDATNIKINEPIIDIAITSPPYINAFDYTQCIKVESALCGYLDDTEIKILRNKQVGHPN